MNKDDLCHEQSAQVDETVSPSALQTESVRWLPMNDEILAKLSWLTEQGVEWGATEAQTDEKHVEQFRNALQITHEHFNTSEPRALHGVYFKGTETVICHTGTSPNSPIFAQIIAGLIMSALRMQDKLSAAEHELGLKSVEDATRTDQHEDNSHDT